MMYEDELMGESFDLAKWAIAPHPANTPTRITYGGEYWFDVKLEADQFITGMTIDPQTGMITANFIGTNVVDKTNNGLLARFLRWVLRRPTNL